MYKQIISLVFVILAVLSLGAVPVSADNYVGGQPLSTIQSGTVSGGLYSDAYFGISGQVPGQPNTISKTFSLPQYSDISWARLYVAVYCGNMEKNYQGKADIKFDADGDGTYEKTLGTEILDVENVFPSSGGSAWVTVNDHCNRVTSDYLMWYDVTAMIKSQNPAATVSTDKKPGYTGFFDGRIKLIALVVAYEDGDSDTIYYWVNQGHDVHTHNDDNYVGETDFDTEGKPDDYEQATLSAIYMASTDGIYRFGSEDLAGSGSTTSFGGQNVWDVSSLVRTDRDCTLTYKRSDEYYKIPLAMLTLTCPAEEVGNILVTSKPAGALISLYNDDSGDFEDTGKVTDTTIYGIPVGYHEISVQMENYESPSSAFVNVKSGETESVHFDLVPVTGTLEISSEPAGAWVTVDGENLSVKTPYTLDGIIAGEHVIDLKKSGWKSASKTVDVLEDETVTLEFYLEADSGDKDDEITDSTENGYGGRSLSLYRTGTLHGGIYFGNVSLYTGLIEPGNSVEYKIPVTIPPGAKVDHSRLYLYTTWSHNEKQNEGTDPEIELSWEGTVLPAADQYSDRKGDGAYDYIVKTTAYSPVIRENGPGEYVVRVKNRGQPGEVFAAYGLFLVVVYEDPAMPLASYWIYEGCDALLAGSSSGISTDDATTSAEFFGVTAPEKVAGARLYLTATAATGSRGDEHRIIFNDAEWCNLLQGGGAAISIAEIPVANSLKAGANLLKISSYVSGSSDGDYMENRNAILLLSYMDDAGLSVPESTDVSAGSDTGGSGETTEGAEEFPVSHKNGRASATHISADGGALKLYIQEGTSFLNAQGLPVSSVCIRNITGDCAFKKEGYLRIYRIDPPGVNADIPITLIATAPECREDSRGLSFFTLNTTSGEWSLLDTDYDHKSSVLSARICNSGVIAIGNCEGGSGSVTGQEGSPDLISSFISWFGGLFSFLFSPAEKPVSTPSGTEEIFAESTPVSVSVGSEKSESDLTICSNPPGSLVYIDGVYTGKTTPYTACGLSSGEHTVTLTLNGWSDFVKEISVDGDMKIMADMTPSGSRAVDKLKIAEIECISEESHTGGIYIDSFPDGADIYIDNRKFSGTTPCIIHGLKEGLHTVRLSITSKDSVSEYHFGSVAVWVYPDSVISLYQNGLKSHLNREIKIASELYAGDQFSVNGIYQGNNVPDVLEPDEAQSVVTLLHKNSYLSYAIPSSVQDGGSFDPGTKDLVLYDVYFTSNPSGARIFVDGFDTSLSTPYMISNISEGIHHFTVSKPGYLPANGEFGIYRDNGDVSGCTGGTVEADLEEYVYGALFADSTPEGAKIYLHGRNTGEKTPHLFTYMPIGEYDIRVIGSGTSERFDGVLVGPYETTQCLADFS